MTLVLWAAAALLLGALLALLVPGNERRAWVSLCWITEQRCLSIS